MGILKNHSPLVGRLGYGVLRVHTTTGAADRYFVEGGFVQVVDNVISVLTEPSDEARSSNQGGGR